MKAVEAAGLGLIVGVSAMWVGGDKLKSLVQGGGSCCPSSHHSAVAGDEARSANACPAHLDGDEIVVDEACAQYFTANQARVLSARGSSAS